MSLTLYAFQRSGLELDTEQQPQGSSPYGSSCDSVNGSPRVAPTSGGSSQPDSPNLARLSCPSPFFTTPNSSASTHAHASASREEIGGEH